MKKFAANIIGFCMIVVFGPITAVTGFMPLFAFVFIGVFLFASFGSSAMLNDYVIANTEIALVRKRYYINFIPFIIVSAILTLFHSALIIPWKEEYFKATLSENKNLNLEKISRKEYVRILKEQRQIYSKQELSREFMEKTYTVESIGLKKKKIRLILASVFTALTFFCLIDPTALPIVLIYAAVFVPMVILWIPDYIDAKILQNAYDKAMCSNNGINSIDSDDK